VPLTRLKRHRCDEERRRFPLSLGSPWGEGRGEGEHDRRQKTNLINASLSHPPKVSRKPQTIFVPLLTNGEAANLTCGNRVLLLPAWCGAVFSAAPSAITSN